MHHLPRLLVGLAALAATLAALVGAAVAAWAGPFVNSAHGNASLMPLGCGTCHVGHGMPDTKMMSGTQEAMCLQCHSDAGARATAVTKGLLTASPNLPNVRADFLKASRHPLSSVGGANAVTCSDCHGVHYGVKVTPPPANQNPTQVTQYTNARGRTTTQYSLCYRCHGSTAAPGNGLVDVERLLKLSNPSFHPVLGKAPGTDVPSLLQPYSTQSILGCTHCHGSDQATGARGPHGSAFSPILKANYSTTDGQTESASRYDLCYRCHNRNTVLSEQHNFDLHRKHIVDKKAPCRACHNSHGSTQYPHLIDFDPSTVFNNSQGQLRYTSTGPRRGSCSLRCHNKNHVNESYPDD